MGMHIGNNSWARHLGKWHTIYLKRERWGEDPVYVDDNEWDKQHKTIYGSTAAIFDLSLYSTLVPPLPCTSSLPTLYSKDCIPTLIKDSPDTGIIHTGTSDLRNKENAEIIKNITDIAEICEHGVNIFVSAITFREQFNEKVSTINHFLQHSTHNFTLIENDNITREHIWKDKFHLNTHGTINIGNNFINTLTDLHTSLQPSLTTNVNHLVIGQLHTNSLRNKFDALQMLIKGNIDIFVVTESKLDSSFLSQQFAMDGYIQFRADRNADGEGVLIYRQDTPCR